MNLKREWYRLDVEQSLQQLKTSKDGLTHEEAILRQKEIGPNRIPEIPPPSKIMIFINQMTNPLIYVLIFVTIISAFLKEYIDAAAIAMIIIINACIGYYQEIQSQNALDNLKTFLSLKTKVIRDDETNEIDASELVPGDIVILEAGSKIPADIRIIENIDLRVNEAILTGESLPISKNTNTLRYNVAINERKNMLFSGTFVTSGHGRGVVVSTGGDTEFGKIASSMEQASPPLSPLEQQLNVLSKQIIILVAFAMLFLLIVGFIRHLNFRDMFFTAVNLAVSAIPEGLPAVMTIILAIGVRRMAKKKAIIRHLSSVETLGAVNLIATDKTGTLTRDEMVIEKIFLSPDLYSVDGNGYIPEGNFYLHNERIDPLAHHTLNHFLHTGILCNNSVLIQEADSWKIVGDPTEGSLLVIAAKAGLSPVILEEKFTKLDEIPFHTAKRFMSALHQSKKGGKVISTKGATEQILKYCSTYYHGNRRHELSQEAKHLILQTNQKLALEGYRVLAVCFKEDFNKDKISENDLKGSTLLGLCALKDAPRPEALPAISLAHDAGIRVAMLTGDHPFTAENVAKTLGITSESSSQNPYPTVIGEQMEKMSPKDLRQASRACNIFARISPINKLELVKSFQKNGHLVAVTGDGINDAPALRQADIGIAMGKNGTDIAREASDIILANDNFVTIIKAIEEGRSIYQNLKRVILFLLSTNVGEILIVAGALTIGASIIPNLPIPFEPIQLLWVNLITDGAGTIPLALEPKHSNIMKYPPRKLTEPLVDNLVRWRIALVSVTMMIATLSIYLWEYQHTSPEVARTVAFEAMVLLQLFNMFNCRSMTVSVFRQPIMQNIYLIYSFSLAFGLTVLAIYIPFLQKLFYTTSIGFTQWAEVILASLLVIVTVEIDKWFRRTYIKLEDIPKVKLNLKETP